MSRRTASLSHPRTLGLLIAWPPRRRTRPLTAYPCTRASACRCTGRQVEGRNVDNEPGPNADVMALSAVADTIAEYKRALARDDFKVEMSLDDRERAVLVGTDDHAMSYASPGRRLTLNSTSRRRSASDGIFNLIAGPDHEISKEVRAPSQLTCLRLGEAGVLMGVLADELTARASWWCGRSCWFICTG